MWTILTLAVMLSAPTVAPPAPAQTVTVDQVTVAPAPAVLEFDLRTLKGQRLRQLVWSPDETELYLQTYDPNRDASVKDLYHFILPLNGEAPRRIGVAPPWAADYWAWKSGQTAPDDPGWKIDVSSEKKIASATSLPMGGDLARGGTVDPATSGATAESVISHAAGSANLNIYTMRLNGQTVGEWTNHPIMPGLTFGWGPAGSGLMAFAETKDGALVLMDRKGATRTVEGTKAVSLPAFTPDRSRLAYLEERGRMKYALVIASVTSR